MTNTIPDISTAVANYLPYLRRYARALSGNQISGDGFAAATIEAILEDPSLFKADQSPKLALFQAFHLIWTRAGAPLGEPDTRFSAAAQAHMVGLTVNSREVLLLRVIEGFLPNEIAAILQLDPAEVATLSDIALEDMQASVAGKVLIIEDEVIIAMDTAGIVEDMGHTVTGIARTRTEAVAMAAANQPDLILADIHLADRSSGIDAVNDILTQFIATPVIFITAFPERLLTGTRPEPAFLITKPFAQEQVRSAVSQAMFFASTETLTSRPSPGRP